LAYPKQLRILAILIAIFIFSSAILFSINEGMPQFIMMLGTAIIGILFLSCIYSTMFAITTNQVKRGKRFVLTLWIAFLFLFLFILDDNLFNTLAYIMFFGGVGAVSALSIMWLLDTEKRKVYRGR